MTHRVRTAFGDSNSTYGGIRQDDKWTLPPQGILQGNGSGPAVWSILSSCIFELLRRNGHCNSIKSSIRMLLLELSGFAYVDDTDLLQINDTVEEVVRHMQCKINDWNEGIGVTGGILSPSKCWWYLVTFQYISGKWQAVAPQGDFKLWLKNECKKRVEIERIDPSIGTNMLGVHLAPDGNTKDQVHALRKKAENWAENIRCSRANTMEVWTALHRTIPFSLCYPLPAVTLTNEECKYIMAPITKWGLPLAGITSTIPTAIKVGSIEMGGLGIVDPYIHMGVSQIENFITNTWKKTPTGLLQEITLEDFALELGLSMPWIQANLERGMTYATSKSWIRHMVKFALDHNITIDFQIAHLVQPKRKYDRTIMAGAMEYTRKASVLKSINKVRMLLNVEWLSDIVSADGWSVENKWCYPQRYKIRRNNYQWPKSHHVTTQDWRSWRAWVHSLNGNPNNRLLQPLGAWQCEQATWLTCWDSVSTLNDELLYIRSPSGTGWTRHVIQPGQRRRYKRYFKDCLLCQAPSESPLHLKRVSYQSSRTYIEVTSESFPPIRWRNISTYDTIWGPYEVNKQNLLVKIGQVIKPFFLDSTRELDLLIRDFSLGTVVAVSDGSYFQAEHKAAAAWTIESECGTQWIMGSFFVSGSKEDYSSYRSELTGLVAISVSMKILAGGCPQPKYVIIGCDGQSALNSLTLTNNEINANTSNADLLSILSDIWTSSTMRPYPVHVKGHQEDDQHTLTRLEKMNVVMDKLATMTATLQHRRTNSLGIPFLGMKSVVHCNRPIIGNVHKALYEGIVDKNLAQYYEKKLLDTPCTIDNISMAAFCHARSQMQMGVVKFVSKWLSNTLATGVIMQRRRHRIFNRCPRCNEWGEDRLHVLVCWDSRAKIIRQQYLDTLHQLLSQTSTHPDINSFIMEGVTQFFRRPQLREEDRYEEHWKQEQQLIGWYNFLSGFIGKALVEKQQDHFKTLGLRNKGKQWASKIIDHNWQMLYKQWLVRNEVLHQKDIINSISGAALLDIEIEREYELGCEDLPQTAHRWFTMTKQQLLEKSTDYKRGWLLLVRTLQESLNIAHYSIFSSSKALRKWVGLNK